MVGKPSIIKPLIDYDANTVEDDTVDLEGIHVVIAEGTYTSLLKNADTRVFITRNRLDTLEHRRKRNRGNEVNDPFIEEILITEHKIIAGHRQLADFIIDKDYVVTTRNLSPQIIKD
jgi:uridine kinase